MYCSMAVLIQHRTLIFLAFFAPLPSLSSADVPPDYGLDWARVGAAGNRATRPDEVPYAPGLSIGAVPYEYRITKTELTVQQYCDFVRAYAQYYPDARYDSFFTGIWIHANYDSETGPVTFDYNPVVANFPTTLTWRFAARYCNWLHNGKATDQDAFESGAYDTSTFTKNADGSINDQPIHSPGAKFWIPTENEWVKAAFYDPKKDSVGGYWQYPNGTDTPLISGPPGVGQTNAGTWPGDTGFGWFDVGSYPQTKSPWGLLDLSGGASEWNEDRAFNVRVERGSYRQGEFPEWIDRIERSTGGFPWFDGWTGLRLASSVPSPSSVLVVFFGTITLSRKRR